MAAKNVIEMLIKVDATQAQAALSKLQTTIGKPFQGIKTTINEMGGAYNVANGVFERLTGISLTAAGALTAVGLAAKKAADFVGESVASTVAYAQSVRELSYVLGVNAEETSRIIQVADDYLISTEKLTTALRFAVKNGFAPSVESLAQLADKFNSISSPTERAAAMVQIFGRNWTALVPMLQAGGDAIRANAAAIEDSLILTDADTQAAYKYQQALDTLNDSVMALKTEVGMELIPALTEFLNFVNSAIPSLKALNDAFQDGSVNASVFMAAFRATSENGLSSAAWQAFINDMKGVEVEMVSLGRTSRETQDRLNWRQAFVQIDAAAEKASDSLRDYSKVIQSLGLSTNQENAAIEQFAALIGAADITTVTQANDMQLLNDALAAGVIGLEEYNRYAVEAALGTLELSQAQRDGIDAALEEAGAVNKTKNSLEGLANAATVAREILGSLFDRTKRWEGPRERVFETYEAMKAYLATLTDPQEIAKFSKAMEDYGLAFGMFTEKALAVEKAQINFESIIGQVIDPVKAQNALEAAFRNWKPGKVFDVVQILRDAGVLPADSVADTIHDEWARILTNAFTNITSSVDFAGGMGGGTGGASGPGNPAFQLLQQVLPTQSEVDEASAPLMGLPEKLTGAFSALSGGEEGTSALATPITAIATAVTAVNDATVAANTNVPLLITNEQNLGTSAGAAVTPMGLLEDQIVSVGVSAQEKVGAIEELVANIQELTPSASAATGAVAALARAINSLQSKTITITVNYVENGLTGPSNLSYAPIPVANKATGGPVSAYDRYLVGEQGPELFVPRQPGTIVPADVTQAMITAIGAAIGSGEIGAFGRPQPTRQERRREMALQNALNQTYKGGPFKGTGLPEAAPTVSGYEVEKSVTAETQTERFGQAVTYNSYFPIQRVEDELDARQLARLVAAELARMPSR